MVQKEKRALQRSFSLPVPVLEGGSGHQRKGFCWLFNRWIQSI